LERLGSPLAQLAIARNLLTTTNLEANTIRLAERHLQIALMSDPQSIEANETLGRLYINLGEWNKADKALKQALPMKSELALLVAVVAQGRGDSYNANNWANAAIQTFTRNMKQNAPRENPADRIGWAEALMIQKDFPAAFSVLEEGLRQSGHPAYRRPIGDVCAAWAAEQTKDGGPGLAERLSYVPLPDAAVKASRTSGEISSYRVRLCALGIPLITCLTAFRDIFRIRLICRMCTPFP